MKKILKRSLIIAALLIATLTLSAPARAEMPVSWLADLIAWYMDQNGVNITLLGPDNGINSDTDPNALDPTIQVIAGNNEHILYSMYNGYDQHVGTLFGAGSDIVYGFTQWWRTMYFAEGTPFAFTNGRVGDPSTLPFVATGNPMCGQITWVQLSYLGSGMNGFNIIFDFFYNGWRYGGVIRNKSIGYPVTLDDYGWSYPFTGTYTGLRTNIFQPLTRYTYMHRPCTANGGMTQIDPPDLQ